MIAIDLKQQEVKGGLNYKAICIWAALGFMLDRDTFFKSVYWNPPATTPWYYKPANYSFDETVDRFAALFEEVVKEQVKDKRVILALSGGLDSRTLAVAMKRIGQKPFSFSYKFQNSFNETQYGKDLAKVGGWEFKEYTIPKGYLWNKIDELAAINQCYSEFTHPRQMAVVEEVANHGNLFLLGHWGDVLFDDMNISESTSDEELTDLVIKKIVKRGGIELANELWAAWGLKGDFKDYLKERVGALLKAIQIDNINAKVRAFKSMYWATRWTSVNLQVFSHYHPIALPYYDDRICQFVCETNEDFLKKRKIQIEYMKRYEPAMAKVAWQDAYPYNLFNYTKVAGIENIPRRLVNKAKRVFNEKVLNKSLVVRNWEIQFLGEENDKKLRSYLFDKELTNTLPESVVSKYYNAFKNEDGVFYSHPVSMLLTLSVFLKRLSS